MSNVKVFGYAAGNAAEHTECCMGPIVIESSSFLTGNQTLTWVSHLFPTNSERKLSALEGVSLICNKLATHTYNTKSSGAKFLVLGGDHSVAIGTWSGASAAAGGPIGMIWIDAHLDSHTPESSHSKNIHGMSIATLLNNGPSELTSIMSEQQKLATENVVILGARDYEPEERELLEKLGVNVIYMDEIEKNGFSASFQKALEIASQNTYGFGISIDIDAFDPNFAPATAIKTTPGINPTELTEELISNIKGNEKFIGLEIAEFFPNLDEDNITEKVIADIINAVFG